MKMTAPQFHVFKFFFFVKTNKSLSNNIVFSVAS